MKRNLLLAAFCIATLAACAPENIVAPDAEPALFDGGGWTGGGGFSGGTPSSTDPSLGLASSATQERALSLRGHPGLRLRRARPEGEEMD